MSVNKNRHSFHLVDVSPWPFVASTSVFMITTASAMSMHNYSGGTFLLKCGFGLMLFTMFVWWRDIIREGTYEGQHTNSVQMGLKLGIILFIVSEIMFFFGFFWAFFHSSFNPSPVLGGVWPPINLSILNPWQVPLLNTILLLSSGVSVTWAHHALVLGNKKETAYALITTIVLALIFTLLQVFEYITAPFSISDSVYGSTFFMATGFHGFHVLIGTIFLFVCLLRLLCSHFTVEHHVGFEAAAWYWHFVDVVWLFLFITLYWWGGL